MGKDMTFWLFIGIYKGIVGETKAFRKEDQAKQAFLDYTGYNWEAVTEDEGIYSDFCEGHYNGSQVSETQVEP